VVSSCGFNTFAKHNGGNVTAWSSRYYMPRIKTVHGDDPKKIPFDFTEVLAALSPRPVFVNAPLHDAPDFEVSGVRDCVTAALPVYKQVFEAADRLVVQYPDAGHTFPTPVRLAAYAFLDRHFRPAKGEVDLNMGLVGHWPLAGHTRDISGQGHDAVNRGADLKAPGPNGKPGGAAQFDGRGAHLEVPMKPGLRLGKEDFSLAVWVHTDKDLDDVPGDLVSQYDSARRRGFHLMLKTSAGVTFSQANARHLQFGIDNNRESGWTDCGRPGQALLAFALTAHEGHLYAGTCEPGKGESGHVYRYGGTGRWIDCGAPALCNAVTALAVHDGQLYAGVGKYRVAGSALPESENPHLGGKVFRYEGGTKWADCGQLPGAEAVGGLVVYRGRFYASSLYKPAGFFRYEGGTKWADCGTPDGKRVEALAVFDGYLYASSYDGGHVYRYDGKQWTDCGQLGDNTQTYSFAPYEGRLYVGTWPSGRVYRFEEVGRWTDVGRLGEEKEVMGMLVHNGRLLAGTLPLAEVYQYEGSERWKKLTRLDLTPDVKFRRAWTAAEFQGQVFFSTLPSGKVFAFEAGKSATWEHSLSSGWQHVVAVKRGGRLELYVNGERVAASTPFDAADYDLSSDRPLRIGAGATDFFCGRLRDLRLYHRALNATEVRELAARP
jgi:hypothetical protein